MKTKLFKALFFPFRVWPGTPLPDHVERVLVIRQDNRIGNLILITPLLALIKQRWPKCRLDVVVGGSFGSVIANNPCIHKIKTYDQLRFIRMPWRFFLFLHELRKTHYDIVFDLKTAFSFNNMMLTVVSGAQYRIGFGNTLSPEFFHCQIDHPDPNTYEAHYVALLMKPFLAFNTVPEIRYIPEKGDVKKAAAVLDAKGLGLSALVGIHTGGRGAKKLSFEKLAELGIGLREKNIPVIFFFGPDEKSERALFEARGFVCFTPATPAEFGGFLPHLKLFISCDTGPMHMAAGAGAATLSFFMATAPDRFGPRGPLNRNVFIDRDSDILAPVLLQLKEPA